ncbi:MAG: hypothetical protein ACRDNH_08960 [Gaiellaceae bacterium]
MTSATEWRELARRAGDGIEVAVLWNSSVNRLKVAVSDERLCHHLDFELDDADAINAFREPFADATTHLLARTDEFWGFNQSLRQTAHEEGWTDD